MWATFACGTAVHAAESTTYSFLAGLQLRRLDDPPAFCTRLYQALDEAVDHLVEMDAWHRVAISFNESTLYTLVQEMVLAGCNENVMAEPMESAPCQALRQRARAELQLLETTPQAIEVEASAWMLRWRRDIAFGTAQGCLLQADLGT